MGVIMESKEKCPKCGFHLTDNNYCVRCGYQKSTKTIEKYDNKLTQEEIVLGDSYQSILHNENGLKVFLMGPLYLCYRKFILSGSILFALDIFIRYKVSTSDISALLSLGSYHETPPVIFVWLLLRILFVPFMDIIVLKLAKVKFNILKKILPNKYQEFFLKTNNKSLLIVIVYFILECMLWYYVF